MYKQLTLKISTLGLLKQGCIIELLNNQYVYRVSDILSNI